MPEAVLAAYQKMLPAGLPDEAATAAYLRKREADGMLGQPGQFLLDVSQMQAVATAVMNPLSLIHGPPGTGTSVFLHTTTIEVLPLSQCCVCCGVLSCHTVLRLAVGQGLDVPAYAHGIPLPETGANRMLMGLGGSSASMMCARMGRKPYLGVAHSLFYR
jgi:hypothetical protein